MNDKNFYFKKFHIEIYSPFEFYLLPSIIINKGFKREGYKREGYKSKYEISFRLFKFVIGFYFKK